MTRRQVTVPASNGRLAKELTSARFELADHTNSFFAQFHQRHAAPRRVHRCQPSAKHFDGQFYRLKNVAEALMMWHTDSAFLAKDGTPIPLPLRGTPSLVTLSRQVTKRSDSRKHLVSDLVELPLLREEDSCYTPSRRSAVHLATDIEKLAYGTTAICRLIDTITSNFSGSPPPLFERQVANVKIRAQDVPIFLRFVQQQGQYFVDCVDDWLLHRKSSDRTSISVGIGAFSWIEKRRS